MTFKEEIEIQLRDNKILTYEFLSQLKDKGYSSGKPKQIGETVLFGVLYKEIKEGEIQSNLITFHEEEIGVLYEEDNKWYTKEKPNKLPVIKKIENGN